jgi:hypothetical protein
MKLRVGIAGAAAIGVLAAFGGSAAAAVTIGQVGDSFPSTCASPFDWIQPTVTSGSSYVVPGTGTITSWTTFGGDSNHQLTMKIFRKIGEPDVYRVVGHDGPRTVTAGTTAGNTFPANVSARPGDVLGFHTPTGSSIECAFEVPGEAYLAREGALADGQAGEFIPEFDFRLNIQATFVYDNSFTRGKVTRNKNKGTATVTLNLPNPGELTGSGGGAKVSGVAASSKAVPAGLAKIVIRAKGKKKAKLNDTGKVKVKPKITYTPTGGDPGTQKLKLKLLRR